MNRFKQIEQLGSGAYGVAVLVEEKSSHQKYVVKVCLPTRFSTEYRILGTYTYNIQLHYIAKAVVIFP